MNRFVKAIKNLDIREIERLLRNEPKWLQWSESDGKNALHYLCGLKNIENDQTRTAGGLKILKLLLKLGMDIDSIHKINEQCGHFPATPLWYAYTRKNTVLYKYLLKCGADPNNCMWAIAWNDDPVAARLFIKHGARIDVNPSLDDLFVGAFYWKRYTFAKWLLAEGADVNAGDERGNTALLAAVKRKDEEMIKFLLRHGGDPDRQNKDGISPQLLAKSRGPKKLSKLFENG